MKTLTAVLMMLLLGASGVLADEVDEGLSSRASLELKNNTREMIRLGISKDDAIEMVQLMERSRFQNQEMIEAQNVVMEARGQGLPEGPVMSKAREGIAKQVGDKAVVQAMEQVRSRYAFAYAQASKMSLSRNQANRLGDIIAQGLAAGMTEKDMDAVRDQLQLRTRLMTRNQAEELALETCNTVRTMARVGVRSANAADLVSEALQNNYQAREMKTLRHSFMHRSSNENPDKLAAGYARGIRAGMSADGLAEAGRGQSAADGKGASGGSAGGGNGGSGGGAGNGGK
ncbi:MAG: hypothetical protein JXK94_06715 [Deltaproteobacteria bacterium]|nr:hypothetical protein [Deltaproteobacteria bacterium]